MKGVVEACGPKDAPILLVGEAPGKEEVFKGEPFVGPSGKELERAFKSIGINFYEQVRRANCINVNPGKFPDGKKGAGLLLEWADVLDEELRSSKAKVIVACGGQALTRLTGWTSILDWHSSVLRTKDLPRMIPLYRSPTGITKMEIPNVIDRDVYIVPMLHPAGVLHTKTRSSLPFFRRDVEKVGKILDGTLKEYPMVTHFYPDPVEIQVAFIGSDGPIVVDTEFNPKTKKLHWVGMSFDGVNVYGMPFDDRYKQVLEDIFRSDRLKGAHNIIADVEMFKHNGIEVKQPWYCTLIGMYCLNPGAMVGLSPTSRYYMDDVMHRKWMDKDDPMYNAYDVLYCWWSMIGENRDKRSRRVDLTSEMEARFKLIPVCREMEVDGLLVDREVRKVLIKDQKDKIEKFKDTVHGIVTPYWTRRVGKAKEELHLLLFGRERVKGEWRGWCPKHPKKYPGKQPPKCERCFDMWNSKEGDAWKVRYKVITLEVHRLKLQVKGWMKGFNFNSGSHLTWFLYDPNALHLPVQRGRTGNRSPSSGADAIERLSKLKSVAKKKVAFDAVLRMKEMQQAAKALSTFLRLEKKAKGGKLVSIIDKKGRTHPPYRIHGTTTGRLAGGEDKKGEGDKVDNTDAYNAFNIPESWRKMYVAPPGKVLVMADWCGQEARLMALLSGDKAYKRAFENEDNGGDDVHSITANIIYGIDPKDSRKRMTKFNGNMYSMRHCAKVANHAVSYSPTPITTLMKNFQMTVENAVTVVDKLHDARPMVTEYKKELIRDILGSWVAYEYNGRWCARCVESGSRWVYTPFGWQMRLFGMGEVRKCPSTGERIALPVQAGEVIAFRAQGSGGGMWAGCAPSIRERYPIYTGTYDSFVVVVDDNDKAIMEAKEYLHTVMEREWDELEGWKFPIEVSWGYNWGKWDEVGNVGGLREIG